MFHDSLVVLVLNVVVQLGFLSILSNQFADLLFHFDNFFSWHVYKDHEEALGAVLDSEFIHALGDGVLLAHRVGDLVSQVFSLHLAVPLLYKSVRDSDMEVQERGYKLGIDDCHIVGVLLGDVKDLVATSSDLLFVAVLGDIE